MKTFATGILALFALLARPATAEQPDSERLILCGADIVSVIDAARPATTIWSWQAGDSASIAAEDRQKFRTTDDCKPYAGGLLLITSSSRGVALIERQTKRCLFMADVPNAHSACLLPNDQIAVAASTSGDEIQFFSQADDRRPAIPFHRLPLTGAHGTVWDKHNHRLWALGTNELLEIKSPGDPQSPTEWSVADRHRLPSTGGHDLSPAHGSTYLFLTTSTQVLRFNTADGSFEVAQGFGEQQKIKSVDVHPVTRRIVYQQALPSEWWSHSIRFNDAPPVALDDQRLYKIRWDAPSERP